MVDFGAAVRALEAGRAVVIPTDTVYGLAAMPGIPGAVDDLFRIKGRPDDRPIPLLGTSVRSLAGIAVFDERARRLAERFWPGPLTLVLPRAGGVTFSLGVTTTQTVGVRVPGCDVALDLLGLTGPLAVTSANKSGRSPAHTVDDARASLEADVEVFVDGGRCDGAPSTVVSLADGVNIVRHGPLTKEDIVACL
jgi:tRNA threonylcarbamoyl adenosine modification protein (Sua5/YciO/YrdC/YwlC family)